MLSKESYKDVLSSSRAPATPIVPQINNERDSDSTMDDTRRSVLDVQAWWDKLSH